MTYTSGVVRRPEAIFSSSIMFVRSVSVSASAFLALFTRRGISFPEVIVTMARTARMERASMTPAMVWPCAAPVT